jgi:hypothetical protein
MVSLAGTMARGRYPGGAAVLMPGGSPAPRVSQSFRAHARTDSARCALPARDRRPGRSVQEGTHRQLPDDADGDVSVATMTAAVRWAGPRPPLGPGRRR